MSPPHYTYVDGKLVHQTDGTNVCWFTYDSTGNILFMEYNGDVYYYLIDGIGNIVGLVDADNNVVATYVYEAYGEIYSATGTMAQINPIRYKQYYYDTETGFYYLMTRYYDPVIARFINADGLASTGVGTTGYNMFAYCNNSPVEYVDSEGTRPIASTTVRGESAEERKETGKFLRALAIENKQNETLPRDEFSEIYYNTYGEPYDYGKYPNVSVTKSETEITQAMLMAENAVLYGVGLLIGAACVGAGLPALATTVLTVGYEAVGIGASASGLGTPGTYPTYTITKTTYITRNVEVANYHGYKVYEPRSFGYITTEKYYVMNGKIVDSSSYITNEYLQYAYRR